MHRLAISAFITAALLVLPTCAPPEAIVRQACAVPSNAQILVPAGSFTVGDDNGYPDERPERRVKVDAFYLDAHEVTNAQFTAFVVETGYLTVAERPPAPSSLPVNAVPYLRKPGSAVFQPPAGRHPRSFLDWWAYVPGASWKTPNGPDSDIEGKANFPVVHIALEDAIAYATWAGGRLPSEIEWEYAAKRNNEPGSGNPGAYGKANTWQGFFPFEDAKQDGYGGPSPVGCFQANASGFYDLIGNVWEWTSADYHPSSTSPSIPGMGVIKGGSYLCAESYCARYRASARHPQDKSLGASHIGFRMARDADRNTPDEPARTFSGPKR